MPSARISHSALAGGPAQLAYRSAGDDEQVVVMLHGGWGYEIYPFDPQIRALAQRARVIVPDRTGYGGSTPIDQLPLDFHRRAVAETTALLDVLEIERAIWWGHSDGAVIAALAGILAPARVGALVLEALHFYRRKPASRAFFAQMASDPDGFGPRVQAVLRRDHGERWREVLRLDGKAWLEIAATSAHAGEDLYDGRLASVAAPVLLVHGGRDPRSEPGEFEAIRAALPDAEVAWYEEAGHSPHSEPDTAEAVARAAASFLERR